MTHELVVRRLAEAELAEASAWYELQVPGLGGEFLDRFEEAAKMIAEAPMRWPIYVQDVRRYVMARFPYVIYYEIQPGKVRLLRVVHTSKDPDANHRLFD